MPTRTFCMTLTPGAADEYRRRHDQLWPELRDALHNAGVRDYRIYLDEQSHTLFAVMEHDEDHQLDALPGLPVMRCWWAYMADIMATHPDDSPVTRELLPMFHLPGP
ncbi:L-rhamnose mutarotase [Aquipseudomonas alcaligenes]